MKKRLIPLSLLFVLSGTASAESTSAIDALKKTPNWGLIQAGTMCVEHYRFLPSGQVFIESNKERVSGTYSFLSQEISFKLPALVISFETDNKQVDCAGSRVDQTGTSTTNFLKIESEKKIYFCVDSLGKNCPAYLQPEI